MKLTSILLLTISTTSCSAFSMNMNSSNAGRSKLAQQYKDAPATEFLTTVVSPTQSDFICNRHGDNEMNYVGKFENLKQDLKIVLSNILPGISEEYYILEHTNKTKRRHYKEYFDKESELVIAETHKKDIELGGYTF